MAGTKEFAALLREQAEKLRALAEKYPTPLSPRLLEMAVQMDAHAAELEADTK